MAEPLRILLHNNDTARFRARLCAAHPEAKVTECNSYAALPAMIARDRPQIVYGVRFAGSDGYPRDALFGPDGPAWIANGGAGTDHFGCWDPQRVTVTNAAGVAADMMAEYVIGGFLHFTLDIPGMQSDKGARIWRARRVAPLRGKTLLIIGLGHTGRAIARRATGFGMHVIGTRANPRAMPEVREVRSPGDLDTLLPRADFIALATPLTDATRGLVGPAQIAAIKPGGVFADVSRGGVCDQTALRTALETGHLRGAVLDVFETEPLPQDSPMWECANLIVSPHCASVYDGWEDASFDLFLNNLQHWIDGRPLFNVVDPARGY